MNPEQIMLTHVVNYIGDYWPGSIYKEVSLADGTRPDIVVYDEESSLLTVIEGKTQASLGVFNQARKWRGFADYVYIACPSPSNDLQQLCDWVGIGLLSVVDIKATGETYVTPILDPRQVGRIQQISRGALERSLDEKQKAHRAGSVVPLETAPKRTVRLFTEYVQGMEGPMSTSGIIKRINHHYNRNRDAKRFIVSEWKRHKLDQQIHMERVSGDWQVEWRAEE